VYEGILEINIKILYFIMFGSEENLVYLKTLLDEAKTLELDGPGKDYQHQEFGDIEVYYHLNAGPTVAFTPKDWETIYSNKFMEVSSDFSEIIAGLEYEGEFKAETYFRKGGSKKNSLNFHKTGTGPYAIDMNDKGIKIHSEEGLKIFSEYLMNQERYQE